MALVLGTFAATFLFDAAMHLVIGGQHVFPTTATVAVLAALAVAFATRLGEIH